VVRAHDEAGETQDQIQGDQDPEKVAVNEISLGLCLEKLKRNSPVPVMQLSDLLSKSSAQANILTYPSPARSLSLVVG